MTFEPGTQVGPYIVRSFLDAGGMGEVYRAYDPRLDREVAVKVLPAEVAEDSEFRRRFERETHAISRLNHKNICTIYDTGTYEGRPYIVMELLDGDSLEKTLGEGPLGVELLLHIGVQVASALDEAHRDGIIHRDIKSSNILLTKRGDAKVLDFGIAKITEMGSSGSSKTEGRRTTGPIPLGTLAYMSPEQAKGGDVDGRSDIFSLGVVLHEMATGVSPFRGTTTSILSQLVSPDPIPDPRSLNPDIPEALSRVIHRALEKDLRVRYQTAGDFLAALRGARRDILLSSNAIPGLPKSSGEPAYLSGKTRKGRIRALAWSGLAFVLVVAALFRVLPQSQRIRSIAVIPCRTRTAVNETAYFCQSVARRLISALSEASPALDVKAYSLVEHLAADQRGVLEIGEELGVDAVASLQLREEGGVKNVYMEVANVRTGGYVGDGLFPVIESGSQEFLERITYSVAENIQLRLSAADRERLDIARKFQDAQYYWSLRKAPSLQQALNLYSEVILADAGHARAHEGMAISYILLHYYGNLPPDAAYPVAKQAAERALELDGSLADAHAALGLVYRDYEMDFARAEVEFRKALELDPRSASANQWYAEYLAITRRFDQAEDFIQRAEAVSPYEPAIKAVHGWIRMCSGDLTTASLHLEAALSLDPDNPLANWFMGQLLFADGDYQGAVETFSNAAALNEAGGNYSRVRADLAGALAMEGHRDRAVALLTDLANGSETGRVRSSYEVAIVHTALGNFDRAFEELEQALHEGTWQVSNMAVDPMLSALRDDPRFESLLARAGFHRVTS